MKRPVFIILTYLFCTAARASTYFVDNISGNDNNSGMSPALAWNTLAKVNATVLIPGDSILLKRGCAWREVIAVQSGSTSNDIYYGDYGTGEKPLLIGSVNKSAVSDWSNTSTNVWKCSTTFDSDIGSIFFDQASSVGIKKFSAAALTNDKHFYYDLNTLELYLYSATNPATAYAEIECALNKSSVEMMIDSFVTVENIAIRYCGADVMRLTHCRQIHIRGCEMSWSGGGRVDLSDFNNNTRLGNGVQIWRSANNIWVERCTIWEMYDVGVTNQSHSDWNGGTDPADQHHIYYRNNLIWNCPMASFEVWNRPSTANMFNIYFENNTCLNAGYGWSKDQRPDRRGHHVLIGSSTAVTDSVFIRNNIFYNSDASALFAEWQPAGWVNYRIDFNNYYDASSDDTLMLVYHGPSTFTAYKYSEFSNYKTASQQDAASILTDPEFVNAGAFDFHLIATSPCIDAGVGTSTFQDFDLHMRDTASLDLGAFEYNFVTAVREKYSESGIVIYPNPTSTELLFLLGNNESISKVEIYNSLGIYLKSVIVNEGKITLGELTSGAYFLRTESVNSGAVFIIE